MEPVQTKHCKTVLAFEKNAICPFYAAHRKQIVSTENNCSSYLECKNELAIVATT